jgi:hypothetical protein
MHTVTRVVRCLCAFSCAASPCVRMPIPPTAPSGRSRLSASPHPSTSIKPAGEGPPLPCLTSFARPALILDFSCSFSTSGGDSGTWPRRRTSLYQATASSFASGHPARQQLDSWHVEHRGGQPTLISREVWHRTYWHRCIPCGILCTLRASARDLSIYRLRAGINTVSGGPRSIFGVAFPGPVACASLPLDGRDEQ